MELNKINNYVQLYTGATMNIHKCLIIKLLKEH